MTLAKSNNTASTVLAVVVTLIVAGAGGYMLGKQTGQPEATVVATVNGEKITQTDLYNQMVKSEGAAVLDRMITSRLVAQEAKKNSVTVSEADINKELAKVKESVGGEAAYQQALSANGITEEQLKESILVQLQATGILGKEVKPGDAELKEFFDANINQFDTRQLTARHILVESEAEAKDVKAKLDAGTDFAALAKEKSIEPGAADSGGALGTFGRGRMVAEFENAAFAMQKGQISEPVQTQFGWHVIQVTEVTGTAPNFETMKDQVREQMVEQQVQGQFSEWLANLRDKASISNSLEGK